MVKNIIKKIKNSKSNKNIKEKKSKVDVVIEKNTDVLQNVVEKYNNDIKDDENTANSLKELTDKILEKTVLFEDHSKDLKEKILSEDKTNPLSDNKSKVEAILFAVGKYLSEEIIAQLCDIDKRNVKKALEELKKDYDSRNNALMITQEGDGWKINVREKYLSLVRKVVSDTELSKSIMETLAIIAWKTPLYQNEVVKIRGNKCYDHIEELENAGFITKDKKGRSYVIKTTDKFYNYFDIDRKNLQGIMSEAKIPAKQTTLEEMNKTEETPYSREKLLHALETIETKSIVQTEEDKNNQKQFLEEMHKKIEDASKRTDDVISELPLQLHEEKPAVIEAETIPKAIEGSAIVENEEDIIINTETANDEHHFQKPDEQIQKPKSLTKKQLEKKFKDELLRVKEKTESKK
ncbi:MAG: SMC-Scp complex subunit ScpB [Candidatus Woesearchaeota archaeon]